MRMAVNGRKQWFDDAAGLRAEVEEHNARYGMRLAFWPRERLRADLLEG